MSSLVEYYHIQSLIPLILLPLLTLLHPMFLPQTPPLHHLVAVTCQHVKYGRGDVDIEL